MQLYGDWDKAAKLADGLAGRFQKAVDAAVMAEGQRLRGAIVKGIRSGAPGGKPFAPLSPITLAVRKMRGQGGTKPMIVSGGLIGGITATRVGGGVFVGLRRQAKSKGGKSLANIGAIHEFGASWTQTLTPKARRFLFAAIKQAGLARGSGDSVTLKSGALVMRKGGRWRDMKGRFLSGAQLAEAKAASEAARGAAKNAPKTKGSSTITITITARPFIGPVMEREGKPEEVKKRFWAHVARGMGFDLGRP